jgi:hypothetical protein
MGRPWIVYWQLSSSKCLINVTEGKNLIDDRHQNLNLPTKWSVEYPSNFKKVQVLLGTSPSLLRSQQGQRWQTKQFYDNGIGYKLI